MSSKPTHRHVAKPKVSGRYLAEYMAASEVARRSIIRGCKFQPIAKLIQHDRAKTFIVNMLKSGAPTSDKLSQEATRFRTMMADSPFEREVLDVNADFLSAYSAVFDSSWLDGMELKHAPAPQEQKIDINGVQVNPDVRLALFRTNKANKTKIGFLTLRYAKGKPLSDEIAAWNSSLLLAVRKIVPHDPLHEVDGALALTLDAQSGKVFPAPGNALTRFKNMEAACLSIAERWDSIEPPEGAILV